MMKFKGYVARVEYDPADRIFVGHLAGIDAIVGFHGTTVDELETAFHEMVEHYIESRERTGRPAQKPYSGKFSTRVDPEVHSDIATAAKVSGKSLNQWVGETLAKSAQEVLGR